MRTRREGGGRRRRCEGSRWLKKERDNTEWGYYQKKLRKIKKGFRGLEKRGSSRLQEENQ